MKKIILAIIRFYRRRISPATPPKCRYIPTCSVYAVEAIERFGAIRGTFLAVYRVLRCNPFSRGGIDFVPQRFFDAFHRERCRNDSQIKD